ncbi:hypothetical protein TWF506_002884 [Arthrobotrys conoides]|uniref:Uncharacterized protein n=1 Tax=Arthrobotrys conoides TaxID=74498 RepID=A0AAN8RQT9_9PEZI
MVSFSKLFTLFAIPSLLSAHPTSPNPGSHGVLPKDLAARWDGDIDHISWGDGWCVAFSRVPVYSRILWRLAQNVVGDFENSGLWYGRATGGKWTVEIKRVVVNNGYSDGAYLWAAWSRLKDGTFVNNGGTYYVGEHSMASIGQAGGDGEEANRIEVWITTITNWGPEFYQVLKRDKEEGGSDYGEFEYPAVKIDEKYLEEHVWKGPDPAYLEFLNATGTPTDLKAKPKSNLKPKPKPKTESRDGKKEKEKKNNLSKRAKYWDSCSADDDNMEYYNRAVDTSVQDCMWTDTNNPYWSADKAIFPNLWSTFPCASNKNLCCRGVCTRDGSACCPYGLIC